MSAHPHLTVLQAWADVAAGFTPPLLAILHGWNVRRARRLERDAHAARAEAQAAAASAESTLAEIKASSFLVVKDNGDISLQDLVDRMRAEDGRPHERKKAPE